MIADLENACKCISKALKLEESSIMQKDHKSLQILSNCILGKYYII